jgi:GTP-binding protein HflX
MSKIEHELEGVKRTRGLHRKNRRDVPYPIIALVGYTNAGKSTLFNTLTKAHVIAEDMLFATLDPTLRKLVLPKGIEAIMSDTVGFISDLPTMLVSAFRATLEEVLAADIILHVRDIAHPETDAQSADVETILKELGINPEADERLLQVWNKADLLDENALLAAQNLAQRLSPSAKPLIVSALTGQGIDNLCQNLEERLTRGRMTFDIKLDPANGEGLSWLYANTEVLDRETDEDGATTMTVRVAAERIERVRRRFFQIAEEAI